MSNDPHETILHVSTVAIGGYGVLIEGPSGAGKSDLALRLIDRGAVLVSDDYTLLKAEGHALVASAPATIAGQIEVRGLGILQMPTSGPVPVALVVRLTDDIERMPMDPVVRCIAGRDLAEIAIDPRHSSAPIKVELALARELR